MKIDLLTLFPAMFAGPFNESLLKKAQDKKLVSLNLVNIRDFTKDKHKTADDTPYGGGVGMVMKVEPICAALASLNRAPGTRVVLMCPAGEKFSQQKARELSRAKHIIILCGHYEGIDERIRSFVTDEISIGDYVLTGGELPAMVVVDSVVRLIPGVVKEKESLEKDSFSEGLLDFPCYTRPEEFMGEKVPEILLSGDHKKIEKYRRKEMLKRTLLRRPDLLPSAAIKDSDRVLAKEIMDDL